MDRENTLPQAPAEDPAEEKDLAAALFGIDAGLQSLRSCTGGTGRIFALIDWILFFGPDPAGGGRKENENTGKEEMLK